jgi:hypothetical protein
VIDKVNYLNNQLNGLAFAYRTLAADRGQRGGRPRRCRKSQSGGRHSGSRGLPQCRCVAPTTVGARRAAVRECAPGGDRPSPAVDISYDARPDDALESRPVYRGTWTIPSNPRGLWTVKYDSGSSGGSNVFWPDANGPFVSLSVRSTEGWAVGHRYFPSLRRPSPDFLDADIVARTFRHPP